MLKLKKQNFQNSHKVEQTNPLEKWKKDIE